MRPRLDPMMGEVVLCARVARQLTGFAYRHGCDYALSPSSAAYRVLQYLPAEYSGMMRFALHSLAVYLNLGMPSEVWLKNVSEAAHFGSSFRRCFAFEYKENRRAYPRVTNRGVQTPISPHHLALQTGSVND